MKSYAVFENWIWNGEFESIAIVHATRALTNPSHTHKSRTCFRMNENYDLLFSRSVYAHLPTVRKQTKHLTFRLSSKLKFSSWIDNFTIRMASTEIVRIHNMNAVEKSRPKTIFHSPEFFAYKKRPTISPRSRPNPIREQIVKIIKKKLIKILTLPKRYNILVWNDSSIFWVVRLRDMRAHIHRAPIDWDFVVIRPLRSTQSPNVWTVIWDFVEPPLVPDSAMVVVCHHSMPDSNYCPHVNLWLIMLVVVCRHLMLDAFALDRVWPKRNC